MCTWHSIITTKLLHVTKCDMPYAKKSLWFLVIGQLQNQCGDTLLSASRELREYIVYAGTKFPSIQSMVAKRGLTYQPNVHTAHHSRIPIDPAILTATRHRFIAKKEKI